MTVSAVFESPGCSMSIGRDLYYIAYFVFEELSLLPSSDI